MSAGDGAKGPRLYHWAYIQTTDPALPDDGQGANWLLIRRPLRTGPGTKTEYAFYRAHAPAPVPLCALVADRYPLGPGDPAQGWPGQAVRRPRGGRRAGGRRR